MIPGWEQVLLYNMLFEDAGKYLLAHFFFNSSGIIIAKVAALFARGAQHTVGRMAGMVYFYLFTFLGMQQHEPDLGREFINRILADAAGDYRG